MNGDDAKNVASLAEKLEKLVAEYSGKDLRGYVIDVSGKATKADLEKLVADKNLNKIGVAIAEGDMQKTVSNGYKLSPEAKNTVVFSKNRKVELNEVNLSEKDFSKVAEAVKKSLS